MDVVGVLILSTIAVPVIAVVIGAMRLRRLSVVWALPWWIGGLACLALSPWDCGGDDSMPPVGYCRSPASIGFVVDGGTDPVAQRLSMDVTLLAGLRLSALAILALVTVILVGNLVASRRQRHAPSPPAKAPSG